MLEKQLVDCGTEWEGASDRPKRMGSGHSDRSRLEMAQLVGLVTLFVALFVAAGMFAL